MIQFPPSFQTGKHLRSLKKCKRHSLYLSAIKLGKRSRENKNKHFPCVEPRVVTHIYSLRDLTFTNNYSHSLVPIFRTESLRLSAQILLYKNAVFFSSILIFQYTPKLDKGDK